MYPSILKSFPVIRTASAKNRRFHVPQPIFCFSLEMPQRLSRNMLHGWKDNSMLVKPLAACTHLSSTVSQLFEPQVQKIAVFTYLSPHFCFPWRRPCDYHAICYMMLHGWKDNSMLAKPFSACTYLYSIVSELYDAKIDAQVQKSLFLLHFCFPWERPWGNHAKCCMDGKRLAACAHLGLTITVSEIERNIGR